MEHETDLSFSSSAEVNIAWRYISTPLYAFVTWYLMNHVGSVRYLSASSVYREPAVLFRDKSHNNVRINFTEW